jgi:hypothetical protein
MPPVFPRKFRQLTLWLITAALAAPSFAQINIPVRPSGVTTLLLASDVANGIIGPAPGSRVRVPPLEQLRLVVPEGWTHSIQWTKDGKTIAGATGRVYTIPLTTTSDRGFYTVTGAPFPFIATGVSLDVVSRGHVGNFSTRVELTASGGPQIVGFAVQGTAPKNLLLRAVGPSLRPFGLSKPAAQPRLRFFDSSGQEMGFIHPAVVVDIDAFFISVGAFPLIPGERDSFDYGEFKPGTYTIHVDDAARQGGTVLIEVYEFDQGPTPRSGPLR